MTISQKNNTASGILLVNKTKGITSFRLVSLLRKILNIQKIGHAGTLDPFATGVMVMLIGKQYTRMSDQFLGQDKEYKAVLKLGETTDSYDCDGVVTSSSAIIPTLSELEEAIKAFQGKILQTPPMFSAKKVQGKKLYELARKGITIERAASEVTVTVELISYSYPFATINVSCSKGTYIRSLAHDIGIKLSCGAHLVELKRTRSGRCHIDDCIDASLLSSDTDVEIITSRLLSSSQVF